jgi:betaine-homocysteine S-methyltransferase
LTSGAKIVGINCHFDPDTVLAGLKKMKEALDAEGLTPYLMSQPLGYHTPDARKQGFIDLPEFPFGKQGSSVLDEFVSLCDLWS